MDGSCLLQMNLKSRRGSTSSGAATRARVTPLVPHPFLPPPMTPVEIMAELLAARRESAAARQETAHAMEIMA